MALPSPKLARSGTYLMARSDRMRSELRTKPRVEDGLTSVRSSDVQVCDYQPGNGTRYVVILADVPDMAWRTLGYVPGTRLAYVQNYGRGVMIEPGAPVHHEAVRKALGCSVLDAVVLAELLGHLTRNEYVTCEQYVADRS